MVELGFNLAVNARMLVVLPEPGAPVDKGKPLGCFKILHSGRKLFAIPGLKDMFCLNTLLKRI